MMTCSTYVAFLFLSWCLTSAFALAHPAMMSIQSRSTRVTTVSHYQKAEANLTLRKKLLLPENNSDICLQGNTIHERADCIAPLLETYYGSRFSVACPEFSLGLASHNCSGCPWSRINAAKLPEMGHLQYPLEPKHLFFVNVTDSCRVSEHVELFSDESLARDAVVVTGLFGTILLSVISLFGAFSGYESGVATPVTLFMWKISEAKYQACLWITYLHFNTTTAAFTIFSMHCDSVSAYSSHYLFRAVAYGTTLVISLSRCLLLPYQETSSWMLIILPSLCPGGFNKNLFCLTFVVWLMLGGLFLAFIFDLIGFFDKSHIDSWCTSGAKDYTNGLIQYSKLVLELFAVCIYAWNVGNHATRARVRHGSLAVIMVLSWIVAGICIFTDLYKPRGYSKLIPYIFDQEVAGTSAPLVHICVISLLGLFEKLRPYCEEPPGAHNE